MRPHTAWSLNAHYMAFIDDAVYGGQASIRSSSRASVGGHGEAQRASTWIGPARFGETLTLDLSVGRWGNTSFDVVAAGHADGREVIDSVTTYVVVDHELFRPVAIPAELRAHLDG